MVGKAHIYLYERSLFHFALMEVVKKQKATYKSEIRNFSAMEILSREHL